MSEREVYVHPVTGRAAVVSIPSLKSRSVAAGPSYRLRLPEFSYVVNAFSLDKVDRKWGDSLTLLRNQGKEARIVPVDTGNWVSNVAWSPSGDWISFIVHDGNFPKLWVASSESGDAFPISDLEVNLLVEGQLSSPLSSQAQQHTAYKWLEDDSGIVFVARVRGDRLSAADWSVIDPPKSSDFDRPRGWSVTRNLSDTQRNSRQKLILQRSFSGAVVKASIRRSNEYVLLDRVTDVTQLLDASTESEVVVSTMEISSDGEITRRLLELDFENETSPKSAETIVPPGARWQLIEAMTTGDLGIAIVPAKSGDCLVALSHRSLSQPSSICFESSILQIADHGRNLLILLDSNMVAQISKTEFVVSGELLVLPSANEWIDLTYPTGYGCALTQSALVFGKPRVDGQKTSPALEARVPATRDDTAITLNFETEEASRVTLPTDGNAFAITSRYVLCNGDPIQISEFADEPANYSTLDLGTGHREYITEFRDGAPEFLELERIDLEFVRNDGVPLSARVILPHNKSRIFNGRYPAFVWQYPTQFKSVSDLVRFQEGAPLRGQIDSALNDGEYVRPQNTNNLGHWLPYLMAYDGYAVVAFPDFPLLGRDGDAYGTFSQQRASNAASLVDALTETGLIDQARVAIGGQSRGGTVATMLLAETDLFSAGISVSGPTTFMNLPTGYQFEHRPFWDHQDSYIRNSSILHADKIDAPLLMIHGRLDQQPPYSQSTFLHNALTQLGQRSKVVVYPGESHEVSTYHENQVDILHQVSSWLAAHMPPKEFSEANHN